MTRDKSADVQADWRRSKLYCLVNGFNLGVFTTLAHLRFARRRFPVIRSRIAEFLNEIELPVALPRNRRAYVAAQDRLTTQLLQRTREKSNLLGACFFAGGAAAHHAVGAVSTESERAEVASTMGNVLSQFGLEPVSLDRFLAADESRGRTIDATVSRCLLLLAETVSRMELEEAPRLCFVAMPFRRPFDGYYAKLYRPLAQERGLLPYRAWGGLASETYIDLLYQMIRCSHEVVADVSGNNPNVVYEVGLSHGMGKEVHLLRRGRSRAAPLSNFQGIHVYEYSRFRSKWSETAVVDYLAQRAMLRFSHALAESGAPTDADGLLEWRRGHGGLELPERDPSDPPFVTIHQ